MNSSLSPEEINHIADEIRSFDSRIDTISDRIMQNLDMIVSSGVRLNPGYPFAEVEEITTSYLQHKLKALLYEMEYELRKQAHKAAELKEVYASPQFLRLGAVTTDTPNQDQSEYPKNYQSNSQNEKSDACENIHEPNNIEDIIPDWKNGDTVGHCPHCNNTIPMTAAICPFCGVYIKKGNEGRLQTKQDAEVADIKIVYASPSIVRKRGSLHGLLSTIRDCLSKKGP